MVSLEYLLVSFYIDRGVCVCVCMCVCERERERALNSLDFWFFGLNYPQILLWTQVESAYRSNLDIAKAVYWMQNSNCGLSVLMRDLTSKTLFCSLSSGPDLPSSLKTHSCSVGQCVWTLTPLVPRVTKSCGWCCSAATWMQWFGDRGASRPMWVREGDISLWASDSWFVWPEPCWPRPRSVAVAVFF